MYDDGRRFRTAAAAALNVLDDYNRQAPGIDIDFSYLQGGLSGFWNRQSKQMANRPRGGPHRMRTSNDLMALFGREVLNAYLFKICHRFEKWLATGLTITIRKDHIKNLVF